MISSDFQHEDNTGQVVLRPNRSWTWRANLALLGTLATVSMTIAIAFALQGVWMILPFTVLELSVVGLCMYYCVRRVYQQEVLRFSASELIVEKGARKIEQRWRFERFFTRFNIHPASYPGHRKRVYVNSRDAEIEIGEFLRDDEKEELVRTLRDMIQRLDGSESPRNDPPRQ